jgi:hypothetical protein
MRSIRVSSAAAVAVLAVALGTTAVASPSTASDVDGDVVAGPSSSVGVQPLRVSSTTDGGFRRPTLENGKLTVLGTRASDEIVLRLRSGQPGVLQIDVGDDGSADFSFRRSRIAKIAVDSRGSGDLVRIGERNGVFTDRIPTTIHGGGGSDTLAGGIGAERLLGGSGNDSIDGNGGNDGAFMGAGSDVFIWDPGDGSDVVEGQDGADTMLFNGASVAEQVDLSANGARLRFFRDLGNITMDTAGVERIDFTALAGADLVTVNDLTGTDVESVNVDLTGVLGGNVGDGQLDRVIVNGTDGVDSVTVSAEGGGVKVSGLAVTIGAVRSDALIDRLEINTLGGRDIVIFEVIAADAIQLFVDGVLVP